MPRRGVARLTDKPTPPEGTRQSSFRRKPKGTPKVPGVQSRQKGRASSAYLGVGATADEEPGPQKTLSDGKGPIGQLRPPLNAAFWLRKEASEERPGKGRRRARPTGRATPVLPVLSPVLSHQARSGASYRTRGDHQRRCPGPYLSNSGRVRRGEPRLRPQGNSRVVPGDSAAAATFHSLSFPHR